MRYAYFSFCLLLINVQGGHDFPGVRQPKSSPLTKRIRCLLTQVNTPQELVKGSEGMQVGPRLPSHTARPNGPGQANKPVESI